MGREQEDIIPTMLDDDTPPGKPFPDPVEPWRKRKPFPFQKYNIPAALTNYA